MFSNLINNVSCQGETNVKFREISKTFGLTTTRYVYHPHIYFPKNMQKVFRTYKNMQIHNIPNIQNLLNDSIISFNEYKKKKKLLVHKPSAHSDHKPIFTFPSLISNA